jgi:phage terminase large subunit-like protein
VSAQKIAPIQAAARALLDQWDSLPLRVRHALARDADVWLRPDQRVPDYDFRYFGMLCGRGKGKSYAISNEINKRVGRGEVFPSEPAPIGLMAPTEPRCIEVQVAFLRATAAPWMRPEIHNTFLEWPNGVTAEIFTPEAPGRPRSGNFQIVWLTEIVDWLPTTRMQAFKNITTACRVGRAQVFWDTTSHGRNDVIQHLLALNAENPRDYPIVRGSMLDNPLLSRKYLRAEIRKYPPGQERDEEVHGMAFAESAGALWQQGWLNRSRKLDGPPAAPDLRLVSIDPALSAISTADETGLVTGSRESGHAYLEEDESARMAPHEWGDKAVRQCADRGAAGAIVERNHLGDNATFVLVARAKERKLQVHVLDRDPKKDPFPSRVPGTIYVRERVSSSSKATRASGAAAETEARRVHVVGVMRALEEELTTFVPGDSRSPNRYDAAAQLINELLDLDQDTPRVDTSRDVASAAVLAGALRGALRGGRRSAMGI